MDVKCTSRVAMGCPDEVPCCGAILNVNWVDDLSCITCMEVVKKWAKGVGYQRVEFQWHGGELTYIQNLCTR